MREGSQIRVKGVKLGSAIDFFIGGASFFGDSCLQDRGPPGSFFFPSPFHAGDWRCFFFQYLPMVSPIRFSKNKTY